MNLVVDFTLDYLLFTIQTVLAFVFNWRLKRGNLRSTDPAIDHNHFTPLHNQARAANRPDIAVYVTEWMSGREEVCKHKAPLPCL